MTAIQLGLSREISSTGLFTGLPAQRCRPVLQDGSIEPAKIIPVAPFTGLLGVPALAVETGAHSCRTTTIRKSTFTSRGTPKKAPRSWSQKSKPSSTTICGRCINTPGVFIHEIGGIETHVHLCISVAPTILISDFIGQLKGASSHDVNQKLSQKAFEWQAGYGVVSFGTRDLEWVKDYVRNQRERHKCGQIEDRLERIIAIETEPKPDAPQ